MVDWDAAYKAAGEAEVDLVEPGDLLSLTDLDETLCNGEGKPLDDCACSF